MYSIVGFAFLASPFSGEMNVHRLLALEQEEAHGMDLSQPGAEAQPDLDSLSPSQAPDAQRYGYGCTPLRLYSGLSICSS